MWIFLIIQGVIGCAFLLWFAFQDWPTHLLGALLALPFPGLFIFGGVIGGVIGASLAEQLSKQRGMLQRVFAGVVFAVAAYMLYRTLLA